MMNTQRERRKTYGQDLFPFFIHIPHIPFIIVYKICVPVLVRLLSILPAVAYVDHRPYPRAFQLLYKWLTVISLVSQEILADIKVFRGILLHLF